MDTSPEIGALAGALAKAQGEFEPLSKNRTVSVTIKTGGSYTFDYATLDECLRTTRPALAKHGLAVTQAAELNEHGAAVTTMLVHESGQWLRSRLTLPANGNAQQIGSAISYARRYSYCGMLGIVAEEDDDGNAAVGNDSTRKPKQQKPAEKAPEKQAPPATSCSENASKAKVQLADSIASRDGKAVEILRRVPDGIKNGKLSAEDGDELCNYLANQLVNRLRAARTVTLREQWKDYALLFQEVLSPELCKRLDDAYMTRKQEQDAETAAA